MNYTYTGESSELLSKAVFDALRKYLKADPNEIIFLPNTDPVIFGGAVRDTIAGLEINDVDVICGSITCMAIGDKLISKGFVTVTLDPDEYKNRLFGLTRFKLDNTQIDLISPARFVKTASDTTAVKLTMIQTIQNVDIRACAVGYSTRSGILEFIEGAVQDCLLQQIVEQPDAQLHLPGRAEERIAKLIKRGWENTATKKNEVIPTALGF